MYEVLPGNVNMVAAVCIHKTDSYAYYIILLFQLGVFGLFVVFCILTLVFLLYSHRRTAKRIGALHATHFVLLLAFTNRALKILYAICALSTFDNVLIFATVWSASYLFEAMALGLFVMYWDVLLMQMQHALREGLAKYRYFFLFAGLGLLCTVASLVALFNADPLTNSHELIVLIADCVSLLMGLAFLRISCLLHSNLTGIISSVSVDTRQSRTLPLMALQIRATPVQNVSQVLQQMWLAGRVVTMSYVFAAGVPVVYFFMPALKSDDKLRLGLRPTLFNIFVFVALATMFLVLQRSVFRFANEGERLRNAAGPSHFDPSVGDEGTSGGLSNSVTNSFTGISSLAVPRNSTDNSNPPLFGSLTTGRFLSFPVNKPSSFVSHEN